MSPTEKLAAVVDHATSLRAELHDDDFYWKGEDVKRVLTEVIDLAAGKTLS